MPVYSVEGKLGTGKTKFCVWRARLALLEGRRVASNVDLFPPLLTRKPWTYVRVPDKPTSFDLDALGHGNPESYDEDRNGVLILDELGTWLNSRSFQDKGRAPLIDWLIHARKLGWDVYLIVQDAGMIDKQVREALIEYQCKCVRLDKVKLPVLGWFLQPLGECFGFKRWGMLPRMHITVARVGQGTNSIVADRWMYRGDDLHKAYDTRQVFSTGYEHGAYSVLPSAPPVRVSWLARFRRPLPPRPVLKPKLPAIALAASLGMDDGWRLARRYVQALPSRQLAHSKLEALA